MHRENPNCIFRVGHACLHNKCSSYSSCETSNKIITLFTLRFMRFSCVRMKLCVFIKFNGQINRCFDDAETTTITNVFSVFVSSIWCERRDAKWWQKRQKEDAFKFVCQINQSESSFHWIYVYQVASSLFEAWQYLLFFSVPISFCNKNKDTWAVHTLCVSSLK